MKAIVLALLVLAPAARTEQFDLACSAAGVKDDKGGAFDREDVHLRVDLAKKQWCEDPPAS